MPGHPDAICAGFIAIMLCYPDYRKKNDLPHRITLLVRLNSRYNPVSAHAALGAYIPSYILPIFSPSRLGLP